LKRPPDRIAWGVATAGFLNFLNIYTTQAVLPEIARSFGVGVVEAGLTITLPLLAVACVAPFAGSISDRFGRWWLIVIAAFGMTLPTVMVVLSQSLTSMLIWRFAQGLMAPFIFTVSIAYIGDEVHGARNVRVVGAYTIGTVLGGFAGRMIEGLAASWLSWRAGFVIIAAISLAGAVLTALLLPRERHFTPLRGGFHALLDSWAGHLRSPRLMATCAIGFGFLFCNVGGFTYVNFYLAAPPFNLGPAALGLVFSVYLFSAMTTSVSTRVAVRFGRRTTLALALALTATGLLVTLVPSLSAVIIGLAGMNAGLMVTQALSLGFIATTTPRAKSAAVGLYVTSYYIGGSMGGLLPGTFYHATGWPGVVALLIVVLGAMLTFGQIFWREAKRG
jgi:predicted MFS family arabinose efflux permease